MLDSFQLIMNNYTAKTVVFLDKEKFKLLGRLDRIIKFADKRISLNQIEHDLLKHPWINDCYIAQHSKRQRPAAWIAFNKQGIDTYQVQGRQAVINELRQYLALTQDKIAIPSKVKKTPNSSAITQKEIPIFTTTCTTIKISIFINQTLFKVFNQA